MSGEQSLNYAGTDSSICPDPKAVIEALLFVSEKPLPIEQMKPALENLTSARIGEIILELKSDYANNSRGLRIEEIAGGFQLVTSAEVAADLKKFYKQRDAKALSAPALETLAIIAYKQPVTRLDIESLRGVNVDGVVRSLMEKNLIRITGKKDVPGHPFVYGTTRQFLEYFGLNSLENLPRIEDFAKTPPAASKLLSLSNRPQEVTNDKTLEASEETRG